MPTNQRPIRQPIRRLDTAIADRIRPVTAHQIRVRLVTVTVDRVLAAATPVEHLHPAAAIIEWTKAARERDQPGSAKEFELTALLLRFYAGAVSE